MKEETSTALILIVEDDPLVSKALARLLKDAGYQTQVFSSALPALSYIEKHRPAAAVLDVHLPDLSGLVLSQKMREKLGAACPIIVLSGDTSMETLNALPHVGATYFLSKPVTSQILLERLKELSVNPAA